MRAPGSLVVEVELVGGKGCSAADVVRGLLAAAVQVADRAGIPLSFVEDMARAVAEHGPE